MLPPYAHRRAFHDVQIISAGVDKVEFPQRILAMQLAVAVHGSLAVGTGLDHCDPLQDALSFLRMGLQCLDDEPLVRVSCAHL